MGKPRHYTDDSAPTCWLCDRERGDLCHVHDPRERVRREARDVEREVMAWSLDEEQRT